MRNRQFMSRIALTVAVVFGASSPTLAAGLGGISVGGISVPAPVGGVSSVMGAVGAVPAVGGVASNPGGASLGHLPIGATDGPSGLSAASGRNPFGNASASKAWASIPAFDPDMAGLPIPAAPDLPALAGSKSGAPGVEVRAKVNADAAGQRFSRSLDVNTASLNSPAPSLDGGLSPSSPSRSKSLPDLPAVPSAADVEKTVNSNLFVASVLGGLVAQEQQAYIAQHVMPALDDATSSKSPQSRGNAISKDLGKPPTLEQEQTNITGIANFASDTAQSVVNSQKRSLK
jgi:hypothetical protein